MNQFWKIVNESTSETAELLLYGDIASEKPWWSEGDTTTPKEFASDLAALGGKPVTVRINSMGGDVFAAHAIYNQLRTYSGKVTVLIDSIAASAASIVAMAGNPVIMPSNTMMMIHNPMLELWGYYNTDDLGKMSTALDGIKESIVSAYMTKANMDRKKIGRMMDDATWMTADKAQEYGLCDEVQDFGKDLNAVIDGSFMVVNTVRHDLSKVKNADQLRQMINASKSQKTPPAVPQNQESFLDEIKKMFASVIPSTSAQNKHKEGNELDIKTIDDLKKNFPDLVNQLTQDASNTALQAEKTRLTALDAMDDLKHPALHEIVQNAKDTGKSADDIKAVVDVLKKHTPAPVTQNNAGLTFLNSVIQDNKGSGVDTVSSEAAGGTTEQQAEAVVVNYMAGIINQKLGGKDGKK